MYCEAEAGELADWHVRCGLHRKALPHNTRRNQPTAPSRPFHWVGAPIHYDLKNWRRACYFFRITGRLHSEVAAMSQSEALSRLAVGDRSDMIRWVLRGAIGHGKASMHVVVGGTPVMFDHGRVPAPADVAVRTA